MPLVRMKSDGSGVSTAAAAGTDANTKIIDNPNMDAVVTAVVLAIRDEINALRVVPVVGLASLSVDDWKTKIAAKLP